MAITTLILNRTPFSASAAIMSLLILMVPQHSDAAFKITRVEAGFPAGAAALTNGFREECNISSCAPHSFTTGQEDGQFADRTSSTPLTASSTLNLNGSVVDPGVRNVSETNTTTAYIDGVNGIYKVSSTMSLSSTWFTDNPQLFPAVVEGNAEARYQDFLIVSSTDPGPVMITLVGHIDGTIATDGLDPSLSQDFPHAGPVSTKVSVALGLFQPGFDMFNPGPAYGMASDSFLCDSSMPQPCFKSISEPLQISVAIPQFTPVAFNVALDVESLLGCTNAGTPPTGPCNEGSSVDFYHTMQLGVIVPDGVTVTTGAGSLPIFQPVPEPSTIVLWGIGSLTFAGLQAFRTSSRKRLLPGSAV